MAIWRSWRLQSCRSRMSWTGCESGCSSNGPRGVTVAQMHEVLKARGIEIGERSLKACLDKGELPGRKAAKAAAQSAGTESGGDPF